MKTNKKWKYLLIGITIVIVAIIVIAGKTYTIVVIATFQDNSTETVPVTVVAGSG